ncbi:MAG TPA: PIG-L family deacetylase [Symbiobacteriaceae bacterium]|jgi:LmbE family N-acetylglucosaminyl deacetylase
MAILARRSAAMARVLAAMAILAVTVVGCTSTPGVTIAAVRKPDPKPAGSVLVFAPHPDDETLGCAGIIIQALAARRRVYVAVFTNGDAFTDSAAHTLKKKSQELTPSDYLNFSGVRGRETMEVMRILGVPQADVYFLGYPDSGLAAIYRSTTGKPWVQRFTQQHETYGATFQDFHYLKYGVHAPYLKESVLADVEEIIRQSSPEDVYVTGEPDQHSDHKAAYWFVRDALAAVGSAAQLHTYLIHGGPGWPWPAGPTPREKFDVHEVQGQQIPKGIAWPPTERTPLSPQQAQTKWTAIKAYGSQVEVDHSLPGWVKAEEVFWSPNAGAH